MRARFTKWGPIVYSAMMWPDEDGVGGVRMALHPVLDNASMGKGGKLPCRVAWHNGYGLERWMTSCRGRASRSDDRYGGEFIGRGGRTYDPARTFMAYGDEGEDATGNAIAWLVAGEKR